MIKSKASIIALMAATSMSAHAATFVMEKNNTSFSIDGNGGAREGQQIYLWGTNTGNANQQWVQYSHNGGYYSYKKANTDLCLDGGNGGARRQAVTLQECDDGNQNQHWKKVKVISGTEIYRFEKRNAPGFSIDGNRGADYQQAIYLWDSNSSNVNQQWDLNRVDGTSTTPTPTPTTPSPTPTTPTPTPASSNGIVDLGEWKLTLPVSQDGYFGSGSSSSAAEIIPGEGCTDSDSVDPLDDGFSDREYFYRDGNEIVFVAPLTGGSSTPNSSYVRSELRELYDWKPCESTGSANWSPSGKHELKATLRVSDYYASDPQTIVGQIHAKDSSKALLKLQWDGPNKDVRAIINEDPDDGNPFSLDFGLTPGTDEWSYVITLDDGKMSIAVTYSGRTVTKSVTFGSGDMSDDWNDHVYYFKAGNYAQADKDSGGNFEVRFTNIELNHSN